MDQILSLILAAIAAIFILPVVALVKANRARRSVEELTVRLCALESAILQREPGEEPAATAAPIVTPAP
jgi:hypothetical protein